MGNEPTQMGGLIRGALERLKAAVERNDWSGEESSVRAAEGELARLSRERRLIVSEASLNDADRAAIVSGSFNVELTSAGRAVSRWTRRPSSPAVLVLQGPTGVGKTSACCWWLADRQRGGLVRLATPVASAWWSDTNRSVEERERLCRTDGLVLDDVGSEAKHRHDSMAAALRELLESRQALRTIITTNLTKRAFALLYEDERIHSRMARAAWVVCDGEDLRRRKTAMVTEGKAVR